MSMQQRPRSRVETRVVKVALSHSENTRSGLRVVTGGPTIYACHVVLFAGPHTLYLFAQSSKNAGLHTSRTWESNFRLTSTSHVILYRYAFFFRPVTSSTMDSQSIHGASSTGDDSSPQQRVLAVRRQSSSQDSQTSDDSHTALE